MALIQVKCPYCESSFNASIRLLRAAAKKVRCGVCLSVFKTSAKSDQLAAFVTNHDNYYDPSVFLTRSTLRITVSKNLRDSLYITPSIAKPAPPSSASSASGPAKQPKNQFSSNQPGGSSKPYIDPIEDDIFAIDEDYIEEDTTTYLDDEEDADLFNPEPEGEDSPSTTKPGPEHSPENVILPIRDKIREPLNDQQPAPQEPAEDEDVDETVILPARIENKEEPDPDDENVILPLPDPDTVIQPERGFEPAIDTTLKSEASPYSQKGILLPDAAAPLPADEAPPEITEADDNVEATEISELTESSSKADETGSPHPFEHKLLHSEDIASKLGKQENMKLPQQTAVALDPSSLVRAKAFETEFEDDSKLAPLSASNLDAIVNVASPLILDNSTRQKIRIDYKMTAAISSLVLALFLQFGWQTAPELAKNPGYRSLSQRFCQIMYCTIPPYSDLAAMNSESLVVRSHPDVAGALSVTSVFSNKSKLAQPFPVLQLRFSNLRNQVVAQRNFLPEEYLEPGLQSLKLMPSNSPLQINLEIVDPGSEAVNYTLTFVEG